MSNNPNMGGFMTQFPTKKDVASWRQEEIVIPALGLKTVHFNDTRPNMFYIQNPNDIYLLLGITKIPTENSYEWRVEKNNSRTFGRPVPTNTLHILNPVNRDITVTLFSVNSTFDISVLQNFFFDTDVMESVAFDGIIKGFSDGVGLPHGNNYIGKVGLEALPEGTNKIGVVSLTDETEEKLTNLLSVLCDVRTGMTESNKKFVDFLFFERESVTEAVEVDFGSESFKPDFISFISNDDDNSNMVVTLTLVNGVSKTFTLAKGDIFGDIKADVAKVKIAPKNTGAVISWRAMFGKRG